MNRKSRIREVCPLKGLKGVGEYSDADPGRCPQDTLCVGTDLPPGAGPHVRGTTPAPGTSVALKPSTKSSVTDH